MTDTEFAGLFNTVTANKKVFVINANYAQGFLDKFTGENVRVEVSSQDTKSHRADDETKEGAYIPFLENEEINGEIYYHGEFSFHKYASTMMQTQYGSTSYNSINLQTVDTNNDNLTSIGESYTWASVNISNIEVSGVVDSGEDVGPVFTVGYYSSLDYPTHIYNTFSNGWEIPAFYPTKKGLMAVVENLTITNEYFNINLVLERNSETTILGNNTIEAIEGIYYASVSLGIGSVLQGENNNLIKFTGGSFNLYGALVRDVTIENNGGSIFVDNSSEFDNVKTSLHGGSIDFDYPTGIKTGLEELTLKNNSDLFIEWGTIQGSHQYDEPNIINITDGSTFSIGNEANFNRINLNITDFGKFNYSSTCFFQDESEINVTNSGILNFPAGGTYTPTVSITAISGGQVQLSESSTLNMNSANFTIEAGSRITLQENSRLNTNYVMPAQTSIYAGNNSSVCGNIEFSEYSTLKLGWDDVHHITAGSVVNFYSGSKIWLSQGSELIIDAGAVLNLYGGMTIVYAGGSGITNNGELNIIGDIIETTNVMPDLPDKGELWNGIVSGVGSKTSINYCSFTGAETAISGTPAKLSVSNCTFTDCTKGINLTACNDLRIIRNIFTGKGEGTAITVTQSNGWINNNTITDFYRGVNVISCSPLVVQNTITNNVLNGVYTAGFNTYPVMVNPIKVAVVKDTGEDMGIDDSELNNTVLNNGVNYVPPENFINNASQIFMDSNSNIYLNEGMNNIYSDGLQVPCIRTRGFIQEGELPKPVIIDAPNNYWGSSVVNDNFFRLSVPYGLIYTPYATFPFGTEPATSAGGSNDIASNFLSKALESELDGKYDKAIRFYEKIIEKYPESTEALVAYAKLPDSYTQDSQIIEPLIELYDQNLESDNTNKKFFKELKVSSHIKAKNYDTAIAQSEEMKLEAGTEDEIILCELDIAIANMLKNAENKGKGRNESTNTDITALLDKLTGGEDKGEPADITDAVMPETSRLYQNYPNPFNPVTQIKFDLAKTGNVKLSVYNINGQKVAELLNGLQNAGIHTVEFDGSMLNTGVYYYTLETGRNRLTNKMILTK
jgi:tetratricopeptide (TPR) repeat protein